MLLRGQRREAGLFEESMGSKASKSLIDISIALASGNVKDIEIELNKIQINIKNKDNTYRCLEDILADVSEWHKEKVKQEETKSKMDKLEELCRPISDYLRNNYCPYDSIVITDDKIRLVRDEIGIPVDRDSELSVEEATIGSQLVKLAVLSGDLGENPYGSKYEAELAMDNFIVGLVGNKNKKLFKSLLSEFNSKTE